MTKTQAVQEIVGVALSVVVVGVVSWAVASRAAERLSVELAPSVAEVAKLTAEVRALSDELSQ